MGAAGPKYKQKDYRSSARNYRLSDRNYRLPARNYRLPARIRVYVNQ
jgi:hypothetical protein